MPRTEHYEKDDNNTIRERLVLFCADHKHKKSIKINHALFKLLCLNLLIKPLDSLKLKLLSNLRNKSKDNIVKGNTHTLQEYFM